ncbi:MAG: serine/threonine-protein kinase [Polyangiaceae bacterium]
MKICPVCSQTFGAADTRCPTDGVALVVLETHAGLAADLTGQVIDGRYRVEGVIGRGGMGLVYAVRHVVVQKRFAMKVLKPGMERTEDILARFIREAQAANAVRSPHIAESSDFGQLPSGHFYVIMELLEGMSLAAALKQRALNRDQLLYVFTQVAETLHQTHMAGIVHRDLKPDNVFLTQDPAQPTAPPLFAKLLDFGVAKVLGTNDASLTQSGVILGTPYYMAPEQARGLAIDHRVDVYSLGVMMYHAFTGRLPFIADSAVAVLTAHALDPPPPPSRISAVDSGVEQVILRCMEKSPDARFAHMMEVADCLRQLRRVGGPLVLPPAPSGAFPRVDTQSGASFTGPRPAISVRAVEAPRKNTWVPWALGGGLMLTLGALAAVLIVMKTQPAPAQAQAAAQTGTPAESAVARTVDAVVPSPGAPSSSAREVAEPPPTVSATASASASAVVPRTGPITNVSGFPRPTATATATSAPTSTYSREITNPFEHDK